MHVRQFEEHGKHIKSDPESKKVVYPALHLKQFLSESHIKQFVGHNCSHFFVSAFSSYPSLHLVHLSNEVEL